MPNRMVASSRDIPCGARWSMPRTRSQRLLITKRPALTMWWTKRRKLSSTSANAASNMTFSRSQPYWANTTTASMILPNGPMTLSVFRPALLISINCWQAYNLLTCSLLQVVQVRVKPALCYRSPRMPGWLTKSTSRSFHWKCRMSR